MKLITLDGSNWTSAADFYSALLPALHAPTWHGRNLDALYDSLSGGINGVEPPFHVVIQNGRHLPNAMGSFLEKVVTMFEDARREFGTDISLEII